MSLAQIIEIGSACINRPLKKSCRRRLESPYPVGRVTLAKPSCSELLVPEAAGKVLEALGKHRDWPGGKFVGIVPILFGKSIPMDRIPQIRDCRVYVGESSRLPW